MKRIAWERKGECFKPWKFVSACGMSLLLLVGQSAPLLGNPTGGAVVAGSATIGSAGATLSINQSTQNAIINWQQFSIAGGETTKFIVPNSGATLNRVIGGNPSAIYGSLQSNGTLYLVNPSGIVVGPSGRIDTAGFLASTLDISNQQFLAGGNLEFAGNSGASVENDGIIHASSGDVYLIASQVSNKGTLSAPQGTVGLAAGSDVLFQQSGTEHLFIQATPAGTTRATGVTNSGTIHAAAAELKAAGGNAYALAINNTGVIAATGYKRVNGDVYLISDGGSISNIGTISAQQANGNGGTIVVDGTAVSSAVSGTVTNSGTLNASATVAGGTGGTVTLKNMGGKTVHSGKIIAKGGQGGAGGNAEVSGATVQFTGTVDLTAPGGTTGNLLLDPTTFTVAATGGDETGAAVSATLQTANLTLNADETVTIDDGITWTSTNTLTLSTNSSSSSTITINAPISGVNGGLALGTTAVAPLQITTGAAGTIDVANFILQSGSWSQVSATLPAFTASHDFEVENGTQNGTGVGAFFLRATGGDGSSGTPYQIADIYGLQGLNSSTLLTFGVDAELVNNIDASGTATWNGGAGFVPIGNGTTGFTGTFNGQDFTISGLTINTPSATDVGLFGVIDSEGTVENVGVTNVQISGSVSVGGLAGNNLGAISNAFTTGTVTAGVEGTSVGGLVGLNGVIGGGGGGTITDAYSLAAVSTGSASFPTGGLVGDNGGSISNSYSAGTVTAGSGSQEVGGLVGLSFGPITNAYSTGTVSAGGGDAVGGLVGNNAGTITDSYSSGAVTGGDNVGGLVGYDGGGTVNGSFWDTTTSGQGNSIGGTGETTSALLSLTTYTGAGWNIGNSLGDTWVIFNGQTRPMLSMEYSATITNAHQLQLIGLNSTTLAANYTLANNIDLTGDTNAADIWGTSTTNGGAGFVPIGVARRTSPGRSSVRGTRSTAFISTPQTRPGLACLVTMLEVWEM